MASLTGWLSPTDLDRSRVIDSSGRVRRARVIGGAAAGTVLLVMAPWLGWWLLGGFAVVAAQLAAVDRRLPRVARPELAVAVSLLFTEAAIGTGVAFSGGESSPLLPWMAMPIGMTAARFRPAVVRVALGVGAALTAAAAVSASPAEAWRDPWILLSTLALECGIFGLAMALQGAELQHRTEAAFDPLTGLLNRSSLEARFAELREQARQTGGSVALIALDFDAFKRVNDEHGHAAGDQVLRDLSGRMRGALRDFDLFYRYGGEEFIVVLPGVELDRAMVVAERIREVVAAARPCGLGLTISAGVAASLGEDVSFASLFDDADEALYYAKRRGRNRVVASGVAKLRRIGTDRRADSGSTGSSAPLKRVAAAPDTSF